MSALQLIQIILGGLTIVSALTVVLHSNPVICAMSLMSTRVLTGALYLSRGFYFVGAIQILVYAGAIAVLFVFLVMLLDFKPFKLRIPGRGAIVGTAIIGAASLLVGLVLNLKTGLISAGSYDSAVSSKLFEAASAQNIALSFVSKYMVPFQVANILILSAIVGAIFLGRPRHQKGQL